MVELVTVRWPVAFVSAALLCFAHPGNVWAQVEGEEQGESIVIDTGLDTALMQARPNQSYGTSRPNGSVWEFDLEKDGGQNQGLLWFDIPDSALTGFNDGTASLQLHVVNAGHAAEMHRVTTDWLGLGNSVTWNNMPGGPGVELWGNAAQSNATFPESFGLSLSVVEVDVSRDVAAWAGGQPNFGWAFLPVGNNGTTITSFASTVDPVPTLVLTPGEGPPLQAGDADHNFRFDQLDLVKVQIAAKYLTGQPATWGEGDWNGAPGGSAKEPPPGDGVFNQLDIISSVRSEVYLTGPYIGNPGPPALQAGDADRDLDFDQLDLVKVQIAAKYLTGQPATWGEGDWNGGPGGGPDNPPHGDGLFNQLDIISAVMSEIYLTGPYAVVAPRGTSGDGQTSIGYNAQTGELFVDTPAGVELTSINVDSAAGIFTGSAARNLGGSFDNDSDNNIFKATFGASFGQISFGNVAQPGLAESFVRNDLTIVGSLAGGGSLGNVDLIYVPEPSALLLLVFGLLAWWAGRYWIRTVPAE